MENSIQFIVIIGVPVVSFLILFSFFGKDDR